MSKAERLRTSLSKLRSRGWTWTGLSDESGIDRTWLEKFTNGKIGEPTVSRYDILTATVERLNGATEPH